MAALFCPPMDDPKTGVNDSPINRLVGQPLTWARRCRPQGPKHSFPEPGDAGATQGTWDQVPALPARRSWSRAQGHVPGVGVGKSRPGALGVGRAGGLGSHHPGGHSQMASRITSTLSVPQRGELGHGCGGGFPLPPCGESEGEGSRWVWLLCFRERPWGLRSRGG